MEKNILTFGEFTNEEASFKNKLLTLAAVGGLALNPHGDHHNYKDPSSLRVSKPEISKIKREEGDPKNPGKPILNPYKLGDKKLTVGWGHAEPVNKSKFKAGHKISSTTANKLLMGDLSKTADGVRKIFKEWKDKGIDRKVTQNMFDELVDLSFNIGLHGLRNSEVMREIKNGNYKKAGELIKTTHLGKKKFRHGLEKRREEESKLFLTGIDESSFEEIKKEYPRDTAFGEIEDLYDEVSDLFNNFIDDQDIQIYPWPAKSSSAPPDVRPFYMETRSIGVYYNVIINSEWSYSDIADLFTIDFLSIGSDNELFKIKDKIESVLIPRLESICSQWGYKVRIMNKIREYATYKIKISSDLGDIVKKRK